MANVQWAERVTFVHQINLYIGQRLPAIIQTTIDVWTDVRDRCRPVLFTKCYRHRLASVTHTQSRATLLLGVEWRDILQILVDSEFDNRATIVRSQVVDRGEYFMSDTAGRHRKANNRFWRRSLQQGQELADSKRVWMRFIYHSSTS